MPRCLCWATASIGWLSMTSGVSRFFPIHVLSNFVFSCPNLRSNSKPIAQTRLPLTGVPWWRVCHSCVPLERYVTKHSEVIVEFELFSLLKLPCPFWNVRRWSIKAFAFQMRLKRREVASKTFAFRHRRKALKAIRSITAVSAQGGHETVGVRLLAFVWNFNEIIKKPLQACIQSFKDRWVYKSGQRCR